MQLHSHMHMIHAMTDRQLCDKYPQYIHCMGSDSFEMNMDLEASNTANTSLSAKTHAERQKRYRLHHKDEYNAAVR